MRITIVTDSHLAPSAPACCANWRAVREYAAWSASELTVHLGDISLDAASDSSQLEAARAMCESWPTSFRFLPGNHDIGDNPPGPEHSAPQPLQRELLERFRILFGPDYWSMAVDGWFPMARRGRRSSQRKSMTGARDGGHSQARVVFALVAIIANHPGGRSRADHADPTRNLHHHPALPSTVAGRRRRDRGRSDFGRPPLNP